MAFPREQMHKSRTFRIWYDPDEKRPRRPKTLGRALARFNKVAKAWRDAKPRMTMLKHLDDHKPSQGWTITQAISLALGSPTKHERHPRGVTDYEIFYRSMIQLVIFCDLVQHLEKTGSGKIAVYVQDPHFSSLDCELFEALGLKVTKSPEAQNMVNDNTFTYVPYWEEVADLLTRGPRSTPRLHLGNCVSWLLWKELELQGYIYEVGREEYDGDTDWWPDFSELRGQHEMKFLAAQRFLRLVAYRRTHHGLLVENKTAEVIEAAELDGVLHGLVLCCPKLDCEADGSLACSLARLDLTSDRSSLDADCGSAL